MEHELQHEDSPTWCVHCGTFDIYCATSTCSAQDRNARLFDSRLPGMARRMYLDFFGYRETQHAHIGR